MKESPERAFISGLIEVLLAFALLFAILMGFTRGMEWLLDHFSQLDIIIAFAMLIPLIFVLKGLRTGNLKFSEKDVTAMVGAANFVLFFVFFGITAWAAKTYHIEKFGIPGGIIGFLLMYVALNKVEGLRIEDLFRRHFLEKPKPMANSPKIDEQSKKDDSI